MKFLNVGHVINMKIKKCPIKEDATTSSSVIPFTKHHFENRFWKNEKLENERYNSEYIYFYMRSQQRRETSPHRVKDRSIQLQPFREHWGIFDGVEAFERKWGRWSLPVLYKTLEIKNTEMTIVKDKREPDKYGQHKQLGRQFSNLFNPSCQSHTQWRTHLWSSSCQIEEGLCSTSSR